MNLVRVSEGHAGGGRSDADTDLPRWWLAATAMATVALMSSAALAYDGQGVASTAVIVLGACGLIGVGGFAAVRAWTDQVDPRRSHREWLIGEPDDPVVEAARNREAWRSEVAAARRARQSSAQMPAQVSAEPAPSGFAAAVRPRRDPYAELAALADAPERPGLAPAGLFGQSSLFDAGAPAAPDPAEPTVAEMQSRAIPAPDPAATRVPASLAVLLGQSSLFDPPDPALPGATREPALEAVSADAVSVGEVPADAVSVGEVPADAVSADEVPAAAVAVGEVSVGALPAAAVAVGEVSADEVPAAAVAVGEVSVGAVRRETAVASGAGLAPKSSELVRPNPLEEAVVPPLVDRRRDAEAVASVPERWAERRARLVPPPGWGDPIKVR